MTEAVSAPPPILGNLALCLSLRDDFAAEFVRLAEHLKGIKATLDESNHRVETALAELTALSEGLLEKLDKLAAFSFEFFQEPKPDLGASKPWVIR